MEIRRTGPIPATPRPRPAGPAAAPARSAPTDELRLKAAPPQQKESGGFFSGLASAVGGGISWLSDNVGDRIGGAVDWAEKKVNAGVDWVAENSAKPAEWVAEKTKDIPILGSITRAHAWVAKQSGQLLGGVAKGATTMVAGVAKMVAHPIDTVKGLYSLAEHIPILPVNPLRLLSAGYDVAVNGKEPGATFLEAVNPVDMLSDSASFGKALVKGIAEPYAASVKEGKYAEAVGRGIFDIGSLVLTAGAGGAAKGAASVVDDAARIANVADDAARVASVADDAARVASVADDAARVASVADDAARIGRVVDDMGREALRFPDGQWRVNLAKAGPEHAGIWAPVESVENASQLLNKIDEVTRAATKFQEGTPVLVRRSSGAIDDGWRIQGELPNGRIRVEKPGLGYKDVTPESLLAENPQLGQTGATRVASAGANLKAAKGIDDAVAELIQREGGLENLRGTSPQQLGEKIYNEIYNPTGTPKPARISQEAYSAALQNYDGYAMNQGYWHRRFGNAGNVQGDIQRVYFNVLPDHAPALADNLAAELNRQGIRFQYKMPTELKNFNRSDAAVLYVADGDIARVQQIVDDLAKKAPHAFAEGSPGFTKPIHKGIAMAEEPLQANLPARYGGHSFGTSRADIIAEAVVHAPPGASLKQIQQLVRENFRRYGIDPDQPWLRQAP